MRSIQLVLFTAIAVFGLAISAQAAPIVVLGNYDLLPNTPGQSIPLYVSGIVPNSGPQHPNFEGNVNGLVLSVTISGGGPAYGGTLGPVITGFDFDSGPSIWVAPNSPSGHNPPVFTLFGQAAYTPGFLTTSGWVNVTGGVFATLVVDTTGFYDGTFPLALSGTDYHINEAGATAFAGIFGDDYGYYLDIPPGQITIVPEPSSVVLAAIGLIGLTAWRWRRKPCASPISRTASG